MRILFIRHGKATDNREMADHERFLTRKGVRDLYKYFPSLAKYLKKDDWALWYSGLKRAQETSLILAELLKIETIEKKEFIATGNFSELKKALDESERQQILIVGHQPHLSEWLRRLCSMEIEFEKGSAAEIMIDRSSLSDCHFQWYLPLNQFSNLIETPKTPLFAPILRDKLTESFLLIQENRMHFLNDPDDPETAHQVRVSVRTFRAILSVIKKFMDEKQYRKIQDEFRNAGGEISYLRELDVILEICYEIRNKAKDPGMLELLIQKLKVEREHEKNRLILKLASPKDMRKLNKTFQHLMNAIHFRKLEKRTVDSVIMACLNKWYAEITRRLDKMDAISFREIHPIRLISKKYRYVAEIFGEVLTKDVSAKRIAVKELQTKLGELCDVVRNQEALLEFSFTGNEQLQKEVHQFILHEKQLEEQFLRELGADNFFCGHRTG